jgi:hypothetical protein
MTLSRTTNKQNNASIKNIIWSVADDKYKEWYATKTLDQDTEELFGFITTLRNINQKGCCIKRATSIQFPCTEHFENISENEGVPIFIDIEKSIIKVGPTKNHPEVTLDLKYHAYALSAKDKLNKYWADTDLMNQPITHHLQVYQEQLEELVSSWESTLDKNN